jgi:hypothetical protein
MEENATPGRLTDPIAHIEREAPSMTRSFHRRFLNTSLLAFAISLIVIPAASAMPVLSDSTRTAPTAKPAAYVGGPFDGYITRTADGTIPSAAATPALVSGPMDGYIARTADGTVPSPVAAPALVSGPMDGYITRTSDKTIPSPVAISDEQPLTDSWYTPGVLGSTQSFSVGRTTPDVPPVSTSAPVLSSPSGFDWNDAGIGLAFGAALIALMAFGAQRARRARQVPVLH